MTAFKYKLSIAEPLISGEPYTTGNWRLSLTDKIIYKAGFINCGKKLKKLAISETNKQKPFFNNKFCGYCNMTAKLNYSESNF